MGILQARILEWVAMPSSRGSSQPRYWTCVSCIAGRFFIIWATREAHGWLSPTPNSMTWGHLEFFGFELGLAHLFVSQNRTSLPCSGKGHWFWSSQPSTRVQAWSAVCEENRTWEGSPYLSSPPWDQFCLVCAFEAILWLSQVLSPPRKCLTVYFDTVLVSRERHG